MTSEDISLMGEEVGGPARGRQAQRYAAHENAADEIVERPPNEFAAELLYLLRMARATM